jgi:hypothetical protein
MVLRSGFNYEKAACQSLKLVNNGACLSKVCGLFWLCGRQPMEKPTNKGIRRDTRKLMEKAPCECLAICSSSNLIRIP